MKKSLKQTVVLAAFFVCLICHGFSLSLTLSKDDSEHLTIPVPEGWVTGSESAGDDFITHSLTMRSPSGDQHMRLGWLNLDTVPLRINDVVDSFKSGLEDWVKVHEIHGVITTDKDVKEGELPTHFVRLELSDDPKKYLDFYLVLGTKAVYVLSVTHPADDKPDVSESFGSITMQSDLSIRDGPNEASDAEELRVSKAQDAVDRRFIALAKLAGFLTAVIFGIVLAYVLRGGIHRSD